MNMNIERLEKSNYIIMKCVSGSNLYGTNRPESDVDIRGLFILPDDFFLGLASPPQEVSDTKQDIKYYELNKFFNLACTANPNILELLYIPKECLIHQTRCYDLLSKNASMFITKKTYHSYTGYAYAQIKRAKGKNKKVHNIDENVNKDGVEKLKEALCNGSITKEWLESRFNANFYKYLIKGNDFDICVDNTDWKVMDEFLNDDDISFMMSPRVEDFCHVIDVYDDNGDNFPCRPKTMSDSSTYDCSSVEHMANTYRLYKNGSGIFKKNQIVFKSIPKDREWKDFYGLMFFNDDGYKKAVKEWNSFWEWMANRSEDRYKTAWDKDKQFDCKNMSHTCRLILEAEHIVTYGSPMVRFMGDDLKFIRSVRNGDHEYEWLLKWAEHKCEELREVYDKSELPYQVNMKKVNNLYKEIRDEFNNE